MRRYCLTYDAKNSDKWEPDQLRLKISKLLIERGAINLISPVASTILFHDPADKTNILQWNSVIEELKDEIYYYLCLVAFNKAKNKHIDKSQPDKGLMKRFDELIKKL